MLKKSSTKQPLLLLRAFGKVVFAIVVLLALLSIAYVLLGGRSYRSVSVDDFSKPVVVHAEHGAVSMVELKILTDLTMPLKIELRDIEQYVHYRFELPVQERKTIEVDWYSPSLEIRFVDAVSVSGSVEIEYYF